MTIRRTRHSVYNLNYHIVLVTKYRHQVVTGNIETYVKQRIADIALTYGWEVLELEVMSDHIHIFVSAPPKIAPLTIASTLKSILTVDVFRTFKNLKKRRFWGSGLFSDPPHRQAASLAPRGEVSKRHYYETQPLHSSAPYSRQVFAMDAETDAPQHFAFGGA